MHHFKNVKAGFISISYSTGLYDFEKQKTWKSFDEIPQNPNTKIA